MLSPQYVADRFSRAMVAHWDGTSAGDDWIESYWTAAIAPEPQDPPVAVSLLGNLPAVRWYLRGNTLVGYAHGRHDGCYLIPGSVAGDTFDAA
jgi:hypothetical protein